MPSYNIPIEVAFGFELRCENCGNDLKYAEKARDGNKVYMITPCKDCTRKAFSDSYSEGYHEGYVDGLS